MLLLSYLESELPTGRWRANISGVRLCLVDSHGPLCKRHKSDLEVQVADDEYDSYLIITCDTLEEDVLVTNLEDLADKIADVEFSKVSFGEESLRILREIPWLCERLADRMERQSIAWLENKIIDALHPAKGRHIPEKRVSHRQEQTRNSSKWLWDKAQALRPRPMPPEYHLIRKNRNSRFTLVNDSGEVLFESYTMGEMGQLVAVSIVYGSFMEDGDLVFDHRWVANIPLELRPHTILALYEWIQYATEEMGDSTLSPADRAERRLIIALAEGTLDIWWPQ